MYKLMLTNDDGSEVIDLLHGPLRVYNWGWSPKFTSLRQRAVNLPFGYQTTSVGYGAVTETFSLSVEGCADDIRDRVIDAAGIKDYLGPRKYTLELANRKPEVGIATGLAWTSYGGEILFCETTRMPGKGAIILTGLLGEVMKESARIALSHLKANYQKYGINPRELEKYDLHIHFPSGAVPKDGPSAGITLTTALASLFTGRKVKHDLAMTGEITLTGKVLGIGGLKEKVLAAKRAGISQLILPRENEETISDFPPDILAGMQITWVDNVEDVLDLVLLPAAKLTPKQGKAAPAKA